MNAILASASPFEEIAALVELVESFSRNELAGSQVEREFPYRASIEPVVALAGELGLHDINVPEQSGGGAMSIMALAATLKEVAKVDAGVASILFAHASAVEVVALAARKHPALSATLTSALRENPNRLLAFPAYSAPSETHAQLCVEDGRALLSGSIELVVSGGRCRFAVVPARQTPDGATTYCLLDLRSPGATVSAPILTMGMQAAKAVDVRLDRADAVALGGIDEGDALFLDMRSRMSMGACAISLGIMEASVQQSVSYVHQRQQGKRPLAAWSGIRMKLAEMMLRLDLARSSFEQLLSAPNTRPWQAQAAALSIGNLSCELTSEGVQILGGYGYMKDYGQEKRMRDAHQANALLGMVAQRKFDYLKNRLLEYPQ